MTDINYLEIVKANLEKTSAINLKVLQEINVQLYSQIISYSGADSYTLNPVIHQGNIVDISASYKGGRVENLVNSDLNTENGFLEISADLTPQTASMLIGVGFGHHLFAIFDKTHNPNKLFKNMKTPIYVLEEDISHFKLLLGLHDITKLFRSGRVFFFIGDSAFEQFVEYMKHHDIDFPKQQFCLANQNYFIPRLTSIHDEWMQEKPAEGKRLLTSNAEFYGSRTREEWQQIFSTNRSRPLRVMGVSSRFTSFLQYCMRDWLKGFADNGWHTEYLAEECDTLRLTYLKYLRKIDAFKPDLILLLDHFRWETGQIIPKEIPVVSWLQDILPGIADNKKNRLAKNDYVYSFSKLWTNDLHKITDMYKDITIGFLPVGINQNIYHPIPDSKKDIDLLYVTHLINPDSTLHQVKLNNFSHVNLPITHLESILYNSKQITPEILYNIYKEIHETIDSSDYITISNFLLDKEFSVKTFRPMFEKYNIEYSHDIDEALHAAGSRVWGEVIVQVKARPIIELVKNGFNIKIYGNHWERFPELKSALMGPAQNGKFLNDLMNRSRICINNSGTSLHMRALEIMGSGAFMLSRRISKEHDNSPLLDYFQEHSEVVFFDSDEDIVEKASYFLDNETEREEIAKKGRDKALKLFGYNMLAQNIVNDISQTI
ncbi:MAG: glycosyltransferase [Magnetococcales bacterium]|nr:glycosyltransferase [Magnetococcales bacterium]